MTDAEMMESLLSGRRAICSSEDLVRFLKDGEISDESGPTGFPSPREGWILEPEKRTVWINLYPSPYNEGPKIARGAFCYDNKQEAEDAAGSDAIAIAIPVEIEVKEYTLKTVP